MFNVFGRNQSINLIIYYVLWRNCKLLPHTFEQILMHTFDIGWECLERERKREQKKKTAEAWWKRLSSHSLVYVRTYNEVYAKHRMFSSNRNNWLIRITFRPLSTFILFFFSSSLCHCNESRIIKLFECMLELIPW